MSSCSRRHNHHNLTCRPSCTTGNCFGKEKCLTRLDCGHASNNFLCCAGRCYEASLCTTCCRDLCSFTGDCVECYTDYHCATEYRCAGNRCHRATSHVNLGILVGLGLTVVVILVFFKLIRLHICKVRHRFQCRGSQDIPLRELINCDPPLYPSLESTYSADGILGETRHLSLSPSMVTLPPPPYSEPGTDPNDNSTLQADFPPPYTEQDGGETMTEPSSVT